MSGGGRNSGLGTSKGGREQSSAPREMTNEEMMQKLQEAAANDPQLAAQMKEMFGGGKKGASKKSSLPDMSSFDPVAMYFNQGKDALDNALKGMNDAQLKAIIKHNSMDTAHRTRNWKGDKLRNHIASQAKGRATQGDVFLKYDDGNGNVISADQMRAKLSQTTAKINARIAKNRSK